MKGVNENFDEKVTLLRESRRLLLSLHKLLVDEERSNFERQNGRITSGQFLNLLVNDSSFQWLRKFSTLIVDIDEMLDLDDGFTEKMIENHLLQMRNLISFEEVDEEFKTKFKKFIQINGEIALKHSELKKLLDKE